MSIPEKSFSPLLYFFSRRHLDRHAFLKQLDWKSQSNPSGLDYILFTNLGVCISFLIDVVQSNKYATYPAIHYDLPRSHPPLPTALREKLTYGLGHCQGEAKVLGNDIEMNHARLQRKDPRGQTQARLGERRQDFQNRWTKWAMDAKAEVDAFWATKGADIWTSEICYTKSRL